MDSKYLREICQLLRDYTPYSSISAIAQRIGITERTLREYWDPERGGSRIPEKNVPKLVDLLQEVVPGPLSDEGARAILKSHPVMLLNRLLPCGGEGWATLIGEADATSPLKVRVKPFGATGFGQLAESPPPGAATAHLFDRFFFDASLPFGGEAVMVAEHRGEWRVLELRNQQRTIMVESGTQTFPPRSAGRQLYFQEKQSSGFYSYYVIGYRGAFGGDLTAQLNLANPVDQMRLDLLADHFLTMPKHNRYVYAGGIYILDEDEETSS